MLVYQRVPKSTTIDDSSPHFLAHQKSHGLWNHALLEACTGSGILPSGADLCYQGQLLVETFKVGQWLKKIMDLPRGRLTQVNPLKAGIFCAGFHRISRCQSIIKPYPTVSEHFKQYQLYHIWHPENGMKKWKRTNWSIIFNQKVLMSRSRCWTARARAAPWTCRCRKSWLG